MKSEEYSVGDIVKTEIYDDYLIEVVLYVATEGILLRRINNQAVGQLERYIPKNFISNSYLRKMELIKIHSEEWNKIVKR